MTTASRSSPVVGRTPGGTPAVRERVVEVLIGGVGLVAGVGCLVVEEVLERVRVVARGRVATGVDPACREVDVHLPAGLGVVTGVHETVGPLLDHWFCR